MRLVALVALLAACSGFKNGAAPPDATHDAKAIDAAVVHDAPGDAGPRGPAAFALPGVSYGAYWDTAASALYITEDTNHRLDKWTDLAGAVAPFGTISSSSTALGELVQLSDGSFLVPNIAMATMLTTGQILTLSADGTTAGALTGVDTTRRRTTLAFDPSGLLYEAYYTPGTMSGTQVGGVALVTLAGTSATETPITASIALKKVAGLAATATTLYVCDTSVAKLYAITIATGATTVLATLPSCDYVAKLPSGDLATGGGTGGVYRVTQAGTVSTIRSGFEQVRGIAYDATLHRMFVVEQRATMPTAPLLHVFPLDG